MVEDFGWEMRSRRQDTAPLARSSQGCFIVGMPACSEMATPSKPPMQISAGT